MRYTRIKMFWCLLFVGFLNSVSAFTFKTPDPKCDVEDFKCIGEVVKYMMKILFENNKELGMDSIDPMHNALIEDNLSDFKYFLTDSVATGLKDMILNYLTIVKAKSMHFDFSIPYYEQRGTFKMSGKLLNLPVDEEGSFFVNATNLHLVVDVKNEFYEKESHTHLKMTNVRAFTELLGSVHFTLDTPSGELKTLPKDFVKLINENPKGAVLLWQVKISSVNMNKVFDEFNKLLETVPITDIVDGEV